MATKPIDMNKRRSQRKNKGLNRDVDGNNALHLDDLDDLSVLDDLTTDDFEQSTHDLGLSTLPDIYTQNKQLRTLSGEALATLERANTPKSTLFVQSGMLATVTSDESGNPKIKALGVDELRGIISRAANFYDKVGKGKRAVNPPVEMTRDIFSLGSWPFPPIKGVISTPIIRPDGSVLDTPGYDAATQLYYQPTPDLHIAKVPEQPTQEDVQTALEAIDDIVHDFPYVSDADRANAYAAMLTPYIRAHVGCVPMAIFEAPKQGTGKSLHVEVLSVLQTGKEASMTPAPSTEEEWGKNLGSLLRSGTTMIIFDNLVGKLDSAALASVLTSRIYSPRLLGKLDHLELHNNATWVATANNVRLGADFPRRCYSIRIDAKMVDPSKREEFRHPELKPYTKSVRGTAIHALLTLTRAWFAAGCPKAPNRVTMGSFNEWAGIIAGILYFAGIPGFLANADMLRQRTDDESLLWEGFFTEWERIFGEREVTASDVVKQVEQLKTYLPEHLLRAHADRPETFSRKLGNALADKVDVRYTDDGLRVVRAGISHKIQLWRVVRDKVAAGGLEETPTKPPANPPIFAQENSGLDGFGGGGGAVSNTTHIETSKNDNNNAYIEVTGGKPPKPPTAPENNTASMPETQENSGLNGTAKTLKTAGGFVAANPPATLVTGNNGYLSAGNDPNIPCSICGKHLWANPRNSSFDGFVCRKCHSNIAA